MTEPVSSETAQRVESILTRVDLFKSVSNRRKFMSRLLAAGGGAAVGGALMGGVTKVFASTDADIVNFGNAAVGAERIGIAFYAAALGVATQFGVSGDQAKGRLLNFAHREYFSAAMNQETSHLTTLRSLNLNIGANVFKFPDDTFQSASNMLAFGEKLEGVFIGAYLGAIKVAASANTGLGIFVAEAAAQILGIECEHRVLIRDIAGQDPPNNRNYEGDLQAPNGVLGNTGTGSTVYASGAAAVGALVGPGGLGISIVS